VPLAATRHHWFALLVPASILQQCIGMNLLLMSTHYHLELETFLDVKALQAIEFKLYQCVLSNTHDQVCYVFLQDKAALLCYVAKTSFGCFR
jgi:hypothetical protein